MPSVRMGKDGKGLLGLLGLQRLRRGLFGLLHRLFGLLLQLSGLLHRLFGCCSGCPGCKLLYRLFGSNDGHCVSALSAFLPPTEIGRHPAENLHTGARCGHLRQAICGKPFCGSVCVLAVSVFGLLHWLFGTASRVCVHVFASCSGCNDCATACSGFCIG